MTRLVWRWRLPLVLGGQDKYLLRPTLVVAFTQVTGGLHFLNYCLGGFALAAFKIGAGRGCRARNCPTEPAVQAIKKATRRAAFFMLPGYGCRDYLRFIASKKSSLVLVSRSLSMRNSMAAISSIGCSSLRRIHIRLSSSSPVSNSSRRVPVFLMLTAG